MLPFHSAAAPLFVHDEPNPADDLLEPATFADTDPLTELYAPANWDAPSRGARPAGVDPAVKDAGNNWKVTLAMPGDNNSSCSVRRVGSNGLRIRGSNSGTDRTIRFPSSANLDEAEAHVQDGLLTAIAPKRGSTGPVDVPIRSELPRQLDLELRLPGHSADTLKATIEPDELTGQSVLHIRGDSPRGGRVKRSYTVPVDADVNSAVAGIENGVLGLHVPRTQNDDDRNRRRRIRSEDRRGRRGNRQRQLQNEPEGMEVQAPLGSGAKEITAQAAEPRGKTLIKEHLPGVQPGSVHAEVQGNQLVVSGEQQSSNNNVQSYRSFTRSVTLPQGVNSDDIRVYCANGDVVATVQDRGAGDAGARPESMEG